jgi:hypothetical protein
MTQNVVLLPRHEKKNQGKNKCSAKSVPYAAFVAEKDRQGSGPALIIGPQQILLEPSVPSEHRLPFEGKMR